MYLTIPMLVCRSLSLSLEEYPWRAVLTLGEKTLYTLVKKEYVGITYHIKVDWAFMVYSDMTASHMDFVYPAILVTVYLQVSLAGYLPNLCFTMQ